MLKKIDALEMEMQDQNLNGKNSDIRTKLDQLLKVLPNLSQLYTTGDSDTKKTVMCSFFAEKLEFQKTNFRPSPIKSHPHSILLINKQLQNKKKKKITPKSDFFRKVTSEGFEPPTCGAEIRYSIQLNYEAVFINDNRQVMNDHLSIII